MLGSGKLGYGMVRRSWFVSVWSGRVWSGGHGAVRHDQSRLGRAVKLMKRWWAVVAHYANIKKLLEN